MILYTMRAVTSAFTPNEMKKNAETIDRYQSGVDRLYTVSLIWRPRVVNAMTKIQVQVSLQISEKIN